MIHRLKSVVSNRQEGASRNGASHDAALATAQPFDVLAKASSVLTQVLRERPATTLVAGLIVGALIGYSIKRLK